MVRRLTLGLCCLATATGLPREADSAELPNHYFYFDERVSLDLVTDRLAIQYREDISEPRRIAIAERVGFAVRSAEGMGIGTWTSVELVGPLSDLAEANAAIRDVTSVPEVLFASPIFRAPLGGIVTPTPAILVRFREDARADARRILSTGFPGLRILRGDVTVMTGYYQLESVAPDGFASLDSANRLAELPETEWAQPDMIFSGRAAVIPDDPLFPNQWEHRNQGPLGGLRDHDMASDVAWEISTGDPSIEVLVMDTGVDQTHPDLHQLPGIDFTDDGGDGGPVNECDNHGTQVAGCSSAIIDNGIGVVGVAPTVNLVSARVRKTAITVPCGLNTSGTTSWIVDAILWAFDQDIEVTNLSICFQSEVPAITDVYQTTRRLGMVHFAGAGNDGVSDICYPAKIGPVNGIAATNKDGDRAGFSNFGPDIDYSAPGDVIPTTDRTGAAGDAPGDYITVNGTSLSSPHAAGVAALALSMNPNRNHIRLGWLLRRTSRDLGDPGRDDDFGWGFVNANSAVRFPTRRVTLRSNGAEADGASRSPALNTRAARPGWEQGPRRCCPYRRGDCRCLT